MARAIDYHRYDGSPNLRRLKKLLKKVVDESQQPDPGGQRSRALDLFLAGIRPSEKSRLNDPSVELLKVQFAREMCLYWFAHAYADLMKKRRATKPRSGRADGVVRPPAGQGP